VYKKKAMVDDVLNYYDIRFRTFKTRTHKGQHGQDKRNSMDHEGTICISVTGAICSSLAGDGMEKTVMRKPGCICTNIDAIYFIYSSYRMICLMHVEWYV
jgi:hypothetical protein